MKPEQLREKFKEVFGVEADHTFFSPGRIKNMTSFILGNFGITNRTLINF